MRATAEVLSHFMGQRADVGSRRAFDDEACDAAFDSGQAILKKFDLDRFQFHRLILAREFISRPTMNFLGRECRRHLLKNSDSIARKFLQSGTIESWGEIRSLCLAFGIIRIRCKPEAEAGGVSFAAPGIKLDEPRSFPKQQNEYTGRKRIERAEMADLAETGEIAHRVDNVVRSLSL